MAVYIQSVRMVVLQITVQSMRGGHAFIILLPTTSQGSPLVELPVPSPILVLAPMLRTTQPGLLVATSSLPKASRRTRTNRKRRPRGHFFGTQHGIVHRQIFIPRYGRGQPHERQGIVRVKCRHLVGGIPPLVQRQWCHDEASIEAPELSNATEAMGRLPSGARGLADVFEANLVVRLEVVVSGPRRNIRSGSQM